MSTWAAKHGKALTLILRTPRRVSLRFAGSSPHSSTSAGEKRLIGFGGVTEI